MHQALNEQRRTTQDLAHVMYLILAISFGRASKYQPHEHHVQAALGLLGSVSGCQIDCD